MAFDRFVKNYLLSGNASDGYVVHDTSSLIQDVASLLLGWNDYYDTGDCDFFLSFDNVDIPKGSTIISATLRLNLYQSYNGFVETEIYIDTGNTIPTDYSEFTALVGGNEFLPIHIDVQSEEQAFIYDITEMIREKINSDDWELYNNITFFSTNTSKETSDSSADFDSYEWDQISQLTIVFEPPSQVTLEEILTNNRYEYFEYEKLSLNNGIYKHSGFLEDFIEPKGTISIDFNRNIIGSISLVMNDSVDFNYYNDLLKVNYCTVFNGITYKFSLGVFMLLSPNRDSDGNSIDRPIYGYDLLYALEQDKITSSVTYEKGETVTDIVITLLESVGTWINYNIPESSEVLLEDSSYEIGKSKLFIINSLLNKINYYNLWTSGNGVFKSMPYSSVPLNVWTFEDNNKSLYVPGISQKIDYANVFNKVIVIAQQLTADTDPLVSVKTFEEVNLSSHPLSYTNISRYIVKIIYSEATSQSYVDLRAERELKEISQLSEEIKYNHALVFGRNSDGLPFNGDCFKFKNTLLDIDSIYKIQSMKISLDVGSLVNSTIRRVLDE